jgi:glutamate--cysteine ligase
MEKSEYITEKKQLIDYFLKSCKKKQDWLIGTEHEKFLFCKKTKKRLKYSGEKSIKTILEKLQSEYFTPISESGSIIGLKGKNGDSITLEPGGQFELSGAPLKNIHQTCNEINNHLITVSEVCDDMEVITLGMGYDPVSSVDEIEWMPKRRYSLMKEYMPTKGKLGTTMMTLSCTVQVNLDYSSEQDMVKKMKVAFALQPLATAIFANSSIISGKTSDYKSYRSHLWKYTDPDRCGIPDFVLDDDFSFEKWVDYILSIPMYFINRDGIYHDVLGLSFVDFMNGKLKGFEGQFPTIKDWEDHLTVVFTEVRMKGFIEMRGADTGDWDKLCALPAFWVGLLYDEDTLNETYEYLKKFNKDDIINARNDVPLNGLNTSFGDKTLQQVGIDIIALSKQGLKNRNCLNANGDDETKFLKTIEKVVKNNKSFADINSEILNKKGIDEVFKECSY